ncbi:HTH-type transcriptional activator CmpR [Burkholderiales bacterium]|nr:HTH-type transcriptional activator CmpR [Burkholderiales bacterium]
MRGVTIRQLQIFAAAAAHASFARTSEQLHLTQAAVSLQIKQLEELAGIELFERRGRAMLLTEAGEHLLRYARQILDALRDADEAISAIKGLRGGRISVGAVSTAKYFAPALIARFQRRHPGVRVTLSVNNREVIVRELERNEIDVAIMGTPPPRIETASVPIADHPLVVIAPPDHPRASERRIPLDALVGERFLVREQGSGTRSSMERFFALRHFEPRIDSVMNSNETIKQAVMAGMGLALISRHTIGLELATGRLVELDVSGLPLMRRWYVVQRAGRFVSPAAAAFVTFVVETAPALLEEMHAGGAAPRSTAAAAARPAPRARGTRASATVAKASGRRRK